MKKTNSKKGFTLVELVIVIAVIAILAAILVPTFSSVINNANETKEKADLKAAITTYITEMDVNAETIPDFSKKCFVKAQTEGTAPTAPAVNADAFLYNNGEVTKEKLTAAASGTAIQLGETVWYMFDYTAA